MKKPGAAVQEGLRRMGWAVGRHRPFGNVPPWYDDRAKEILARVRPYTMLHNERLFTLIEAVRYIMRYGIAGDLVECGVWKGGAVMAMAEVLKDAGGPGERRIWLYDTFEGMPEPEAVDRSHRGIEAHEKWQNTMPDAASHFWAIGGQQEVGANLARTGLGDEVFRMVPGKIEETVPGEMPERIALLRLDTDWYASTRHELEHLFPRLVTGGVLIVDDYGDWAGCKQAVDEFLAGYERPLLPVPAAGNLVMVKQ